MSEKSDLYSYILSRHSIRNYSQQPLNAEDKLRVDDILTSVKPLVPDNHFEVIFKTRTKVENLVEILGAYGRFITPSYYLVPFIDGPISPLVDLGFRCEQIAVRLWSIGLGTCFIGCLSREGKVHQLFHLPGNTRIGAFLIFGYPGDGFGFQTVTNLAKFISGNSNRKPIQDLFFDNDFEHPELPPKNLSKLILAGCRAPSAVNAQPWRFLYYHDELFLFVTRNNRKYYLPENENYCFYDGGICMGNIQLAMESLGINGSWLLLDEKNTSIPLHPDDLFPLAKLIFH